MLEEGRINDISKWRRYSFIVIGIVVLVGIILLFISNIWQRPKPEVPLNKIVPVNIVIPKVTQSLLGEITAGFPKDIPLNGKTSVTKSYSATYPNTPAKQSSVEFISSKSPKENFDFYTKWAGYNSWKIINSSTTPVFSLYFRKLNEDINITIKGNSVNITYIIQK